MINDRSEYERQQIESLLQSGDARCKSGTGLFLAPMLDEFSAVQAAAVAPAMRVNGIEQTEIVRVFNSDSLLSEVCARVQSAEIIVADVTARNGDVMYVLGLCHGLRRCPLMIAQVGIDLPFNLAALRCIEYGGDVESLWELREHLTRAIRVFLTATRAGGE